MDYGRPLEFGISLVPNADDQDLILELATVADEAGIELLGIQDHPYQRRFLDTWTLLSFLAARTERLRLFPDVANLPLRLPGVLAKSAASLDRLSGGRVELGLGAGAFWEGVKAMGGPVRTPGEAVSALEEAIQIMRLVWSEERGVSFEGEHYQLSGLHPGPPPAHPIEIWLGAYKPRMLALTGPPRRRLAALARQPAGERRPGRAGAHRRARPVMRDATRRTSVACSTSRARSPTASRARGRSTAPPTRSRRPSSDSPSSTASTPSSSGRASPAPTRSSASRPT